MEQCRVRAPAEGLQLLLCGVEQHLDRHRLHAPGRLAHLLTHRHKTLSFTMLARSWRSRQAPAWLQYLAAQPIGAQ